jgi:glycosyltransferase involved in cell wall biosynthesis
MLPRPLNLGGLMSNGHAKPPEHDVSALGHSTALLRLFRHATVPVRLTRRARSMHKTPVGCAMNGVRSIRSVTGEAATMWHCVCFSIVMRIAQVAPLYESVPPQLYGGTERIVHYLTEELVALGHDVTLYAAGDSQTSADLVSVCPRSLRLDDSCIDSFAHHVTMLELLSRHHHEYDVIHFHIDYHHFMMSRLLGLPQLTTLHGRLDLPDLQALYFGFQDMPVVSISDAQRLPLPQANWVGTVLHGLPTHLLKFSPKPSDYFAFLGRVSPEKRVDRAIEIATTLNVPIRIAAKVDKKDQEYFETEIEPLLQHPLVEYIGEISESEKSEFIGGARALLFPIDWPEPFGLVMIEAMACGTPVVAFEHGSVPEVLEDGVSGFIVRDMPQAIEAARRATRLDRSRVRETFERDFSARRMALDYLELYREICEKPENPPAPSTAKTRTVAA